ncbi:MAG: HI_0552 family protein [Clostridioides difficile]|nr:HI_0552 family protein [Clostridioides difficile]
MKFEKKWFEILDRGDFTYRKGDYETMENFKKVRAEWIQWCNKVAKHNRKFKEPIVKQWQNQGSLSKDFWTRLKYIPYEKSASCVSLYFNKDELAIEVTYEYTKESQSEISKVEFNKLLVENLKNWVDENSINIDLYYFYYDDGENTNYKSMMLREYFEKEISIDNFDNIEKKRFVVGAAYDRKEAVKLDTEDDDMIAIILQLSRLYEKVQKKNEVYECLVKSEDLNPDEHDGSYELVRETTKVFKNVPYEKLDFSDLDALFFTSVGTFKRKTESKKQLIIKSHLDDVDKLKIINLMDKIDKKAGSFEYGNNHTKGYVGMFGTGFMTFNKNSNDINDGRKFIKLCTDIVNMNEEDEIISRVEETLKYNLKGIGIGTISTFLHCLKPCIFPIINGKEGQGIGVYDKLHIKLTKSSDTKKYIENTRIIEDYRDKYFKFKNYRVIDLIQSNKVENQLEIEDVISEKREAYTTYKVEQCADVETSYEKYSKDDFLKEAFISEDKYYQVVKRLKIKKNIILQGAPGVGKSFIGKKIAYSLLGKKDSDKVEMIQFHQSYSYEDFIMGYRPNESGGFKLKEGVFYKFCKKAQNNSSENYYFIIDEINRGNLSKIFGELMLLIENDKRGQEFALDTTYSNEGMEKIYIPNNLYIIGLMNTADRSIALIDYALRRRFSFIEIEPAFEYGFKRYAEKFADTNLYKVINIIVEINNDIEKDESLGRGFKIGHSYFCSLKEGSDEELLDIVECDILPLIEEYWFENPSKIEEYADEFYEVLKNG